MENIRASFQEEKKNDDRHIICVVSVQVTICALWSCWVMYLMSFEGGRPVPFTSTLFAKQVVSLPPGSQNNSN